MSKVYDKFPLLELIAQVQWQVSHNNLTPDFDLWFARLTTELSSIGYDLVERLSPVGAPSMPHQPLFRFRKSKNINEVFPMVQFGPGIFSVHAGPPSYSAWDNFRPTVSDAINCLIKSGDVESTNKFIQISLRYIDLFDKDWRGNKSSYKFIRDDLDIGLKLPFDFESYSQSIDTIKPSFSINFPLKGDPKSQMVFSVVTGSAGPPNIGGETPKTLDDSIMDLSCVTSGPVERNISEVLSVLDNSHDVLHDWFTKIIKKIEPTMNA